MRLIDQYVRPEDKNSRVVVFSESRSYESFDVFRKKGYEVLLDTEPLSDVWMGMVESDVLILSRSMFGLIPAFLHQGKVAYLPYKKIKPLPSWDVIRANDPIAREAKEGMVVRFSIGAAKPIARCD